MILNIIEYINCLNYLISVFEVVLIIKNKILYIFGSNNFYMKDFNYFQNIKKNEDFKLIIKNYILKDYFIFNNYHNINSKKFWLFDQQQWFFLNLEIFIIGFQKFVYEYVNVIKPLFNWYHNYKTLVYKNISLDLLLDIQNENNKSLIWLIQNKEHLNKILIKKAIINNLNFEISLWNNLSNRNFYISDDSWFGYKYLKKYYSHYFLNENKILRDWYKNETCDKLYDNWQYWNIYQDDKERIYSSTIFKDVNNTNLKKNFWIKIFENFNIIFKKKPYKVFFNIYYLNNKYPRVNLLTYGLLYDLNIFTEKNYENKSIFYSSWKNISNKDQFYNEVINKSLKTWYSIYHKYDALPSDYNLFYENIYLYNTFYNKYYENMELDNDFVPDIIKLKGGIKETLNKFIVPSIRERINIINSWNNRFEYLTEKVVNGINYMEILYNVSYKLSSEFITKAEKLGLEKDFFFKVYSRFKTELIFPAINETTNIINIVMPKIYETANTINVIMPKIYEKYQNFIDDFIISAKKIIFNDEKKNYLKDKNIKFTYFFEKKNNKNLIKLPIYPISNKIENKIIFKQLYNLNANINQIINPVIAPTIYISDMILNPIIYLNKKIMATLDNLVIIPTYNITVDVTNKTKNILYNIYNINKNISYDVNKDQIINLLPNLIAKIWNWDQLNKKSMIIDNYLGNYTNIWNIYHDSGEYWDFTKGRAMPFRGHERLVYYVPYNWIKVDIKKVMDSVNKYNYLWVWKNPAKQSLSELRSYFYDPDTTIVNRKLVLVSELKKKAKIEEKKLWLQQAKEKKVLIDDSTPEDWFFSRLYSYKYIKLVQLFDEGLSDKILKRANLKKVFNDTKYVEFVSEMQEKCKQDALLMEEQRNKRLFGQLIVRKETELDRWIKEKDPLNISGRWKGTEFYMSELFWVSDLIYFYEEKQQPWSVFFPIYKFHDFSHITTMKALRQFYKVREFTDLADKELEYYPRDMVKRFYTVGGNARKKAHYIMNLEGYNQLLINKNIFKTALLSDDFYSSNSDKPFSLKKKVYRLSLWREDFRNFKTDIIYSIKNRKDDSLIFSKFKYNKPDMLQNLHHKTQFSILRKRTKDLDPFFSSENWWNQGINEVFFPKNSKTRMIPINSHFYWYRSQYMYDMVQLRGNHKLPITKIEQHEIDFFINENKKILEKSKKLYKTSTNNTWSILREEYLNFLYSNKDKMNKEFFLKKNSSLTWDIFCTQIEDVTESLNLNIVNKKIYGNSLYNNNKLLPKNTNVLLKKRYIIQLLNVFQEEEQSIKNYILFKINKNYFRFINYKLIKDYKVYDHFKWFFISLNKSFFFSFDFIKEALLVKLLEYKQIKIAVKYYKILNINVKFYINVLIIITVIFVYCLITSALVILIKSFLPKNLVYSIKIKQNNLKEKNWEPINEASKFIEDLTLEDLNKLLYDTKKKKLKIVNNVNEIDDINIENIQKLKLQKKLNNFQLKKNFFDAESRYIYTWEQRYGKIYYEDSSSIRKGVHNLKKIKVYNKFEAKRKKDLKKNYIIFYKKFLFEKNLEKWENNTKFRLEDPLDWYVIINSWIVRFKKLIEVFRRDKRYNHNRVIFWEDPTLDEWTKVTYVYIIPKPFFNFFFVIKFIIGSIKLWSFSYWIQKWRQYIMYGVRTRVSYKELKEHLEKEWSLEWYKDNSDYDSALYLKNMMKIAEKFNSIKNLPLNKEVADKKKKRDKILGKVITLISEDNKYRKITQYLAHLEKIKLERIENSFDKKFVNINKNLILDVNEVDPKKWIEQTIRHKYKDVIFHKKLEAEKEEYKTLKQGYTKRVRHDMDDKKKTMQILKWTDEKKIKTIMEEKMAILEYEKKLRNYNFENQLIDEALDLKEKAFFESIKEYNQELSDAYLEYEEDQKKEKMQEQITERKTGLLYSIYDKYYPYYRKWTTMGARTNYILSQIIMIFAGWIDNFKRIRRNEYNIQNIFKTIWIDLLEYINKMYWEFMIVFKEYESLKKWGLNIKTILKFSFIFIPILIYFSILYFIFFIFFWWMFIFKKTQTNMIKKIWTPIKQKIENKLNIFINKYNKYSKYIKRVNKIKNYFKFIKSIFNLFFKNLETGNSILDELYLKFYNICAWIQRTIYFIKGAFILKYNENKNIKEGLYSVKEYLVLRYKSYLEIKKTKKVKIKNKKNLIIKIEVLLVLLDIDFLWKKNKKKVLWRIYKYIVYPIFKIDWKTFYNIYRKNMELYDEYKKIFEKNLMYVYALKNIKSWDLIKLALVSIWKLFTLPFIYIIKHQQNKYVKNYKQGIQGFRDNSMYKIIDKPKKIISWKIKLHNILMKRLISKYLHQLLETQSHIVEMFFMYKILEAKWTKKNYYQDFFWRKWYWYIKTYKKKIIDWLLEYILLIEESYQNFEEEIETRNWTLLERLKYSIYMYKMYNHVMTRATQRDISRNIFFYKKAKERDKLIRIYFIKGIINWIWYIIFNKVIFKKVKDLKYKKLKNKNLKYYIKNIKGIIHLSGYIEEVPPQFWALVIIYNKYYRYLLKYVYNDPAFPIKWQENKNLEYDRDYKWRLAAPEHNYDIPFYDRRFIATDMNSFHFKEFISSLANQPYDPLIRWILFVLEYGLTKEVLIEQGNKIFMNEENDVWGVWSDVSLPHLLTYSRGIDEYTYEIKEFNRLIQGIDFLKVAQFTLERDKMNYYFDRFKFIKEKIILKNKDVLQNMLKKRKLQKAKMLHKALLRNKLKTTAELEDEQEEENKKEYFYVKKKEFFEELIIEQYWNWQSEYDSKTVEDKYFNWDDLWDATYNAQNAEEYYLSQGKLVNYNYLIDHIVLLSFDETFEEIYSFLMYTIWKNLDKELSTKKDKKYINYKNLRIDDNILSRLNYTEHLYLKKVEIEDKKTQKKQTKMVYDYLYPKIEWETLRVNPLHNYIENNLLWMYYEVGDVFTYQEKIEFNIEAAPYQRETFYHDQEILSRLLNIITERNKKLKNIKRNKIKNKGLREKTDFAYVNNIKWTLEQWLIYANIENESEILKKNIVVLNERYNLWNLKRVPVRMKVPVMLEVEDEHYIDEFLDDTSQFISYGYYLMSSTVTPILKQSLEWEQCKIFLEKHFNKDIKDIILWVFTADLFNKEVLKIKRDYKFVLKNFIQNYGVFHRLYFIGLPHYSWDLIRYLEIWFGRDEFPYHQYFQLKQMEFLNHDPAAKKIVEKLHNLFIDKYKPISFIYFFKYQLFFNYFNYILNIIIVSNFIWLLKTLFYSPGEFLGNNYLLFGPLLFLFICFYFKKRFKKMKDLNKGMEIYLYKYRSSKIRTLSEWQKTKLHLDRSKKAWLEHFYDRDKIYELFGSLGSNILAYQRDPNWWRHHTHLTKDSELAQSKQIFFLVSVMFWLFVGDFWGWYKHRYRNSNWVWDYYKIDISELNRAKKANIHVSKNLKERLWIEDSWDRLENGNSLFCKWYENYYLGLRHLPLRDLDYGNVGRAKNINFELFYKGWERQDQHIFYKSGFSDSYWTLLSRHLEMQIMEDQDDEGFRFFFFGKEYEKLTEKVSKLYYRSAKWKTLENKEIIKVLDVQNRRNFEKKVSRLSKNWESYQDNIFFFKEIATNKENYRNYMMNIKKYDILKKNIKTAINDYIEDYWIWKLGKLYNIYYPLNPEDKWPGLIQWAKDECNFDFKEVSTLYTRFLTEMQEKIYILIWKDIRRYALRKDVSIFGDYYNKVMEKKKYMYNIHKKCFETGKPFDVDVLIEITNNEKHYHNFCYHMVKYNLERFIIIKKCDINRLYRHYKPKVPRKNWSRIEDIDLMLVKYLRKKGRYIKNINKDISKSEIADYKIKLLTNFIKEKTNFWFFWENFTFKWDLVEVFLIIIKFILKILS